MLKQLYTLGVRASKLVNGAGKTLKSMLCFCDGREAAPLGCCNFSCLGLQKRHAPERLVEPSLRKEPFGMGRIALA